MIGKENFLLIKVFFSILLLSYLRTFHHLMSSKKLAIFDFDGTITTRDTLLEFIRFYSGNIKFLAGFLFASPVIVLSKLKIIPNWRAKEIVLTWFFKNEDFDHFNEKGKAFALNYTPALVRSKANEEISLYLQSGWRVVVVSASAENWVKPWCDSVGVECIATKLETRENKLTGKISGKNCYGPEKVARIREQLNPAEYHDIVVYGDSAGDREMLLLGTERFYKPFR